MSEWIKVKDKLPPFLTQVLLWSEESNCLMQGQLYPYFKEKDDMIFDVVCFERLTTYGSHSWLYDFNKITHWRPMISVPDRG